MLSFFFRPWLVASDKRAICRTKDLRERLKELKGGECVCGGVCVCVCVCVCVRVCVRVCVCVCVRVRVRVCVCVRVLLSLFCLGFFQCGVFSIPIVLLILLTGTVFTARR